MAHPERTAPPTPEAAAVRAAGDLLGVGVLAELLGTSERTVYNWMAGKRTPPPGILPEIREHLVKHRQRTADLIGAIRAVEDGRISGSEAK